MSMTADERQRWKARMRRLESAEELSEGTPAQRAKAVADADRHRADAGRAPLAPWWAEKTEHRFHERARALGLLRPHR